MKITILTAGSRGDVQPFIALGMGLKKAGHDVAICTSSSFEGFVTGYGLGYAFMNDELVKFVKTAEGRDAFEASSNMFGWMKKALELMKKFKPVVLRMLDEEWAAARDSEAIIYYPKALGGYHIAEKLRVPAFMSLPMPLATPTRAFPCPIFPDLKLGGWYNRLSYKFLPLMGFSYAGVINKWREEVLGLPRRPFLASRLVQGNGQPVPTLYCYSTHIVPRPDDWPETTIATGYWFLDGDTGWRPPAGLTEFLAAGPPPVYVGFGSIAGRNPERTTGIVLDALARSGQRGLIARGWGGLETSDLPRSVFSITSAPHEWLFPQVRAVVHHGGAGTTAAGLRAGKPTVVCPFFGDQPFWGKRVFELGAGPKPIHQKRLTTDKFAAAVRQAVTDDGMRRRAAKLGEKIRNEDGVARAVEYINDTLSTSPRIRPA